MTQTLQCRTFAVKVADLAADGQGLLEGVEGVVEPREFAVGRAEAGEGVAFAVAVAYLAAEARACRKLSRASSNRRNSR